MAVGQPLALGPQPYPPLSNAEVRITDAKGDARKMALSNGDWGAWSGPLRRLPPGQSIDVPAMLAPLPVGVYAIQFDKGVTAKVTVKDDAKLGRKQGQGLLEKLRQGDDIFARYVFIQYPDPAVTAALLDDLLSDDGRVAGSAARALTRLRKFPKDAGKIVRSAMQNQLELVARQQNRDSGALIDLVYLAGHVRTDDALAAVLELAHSEKGRGPREDAMNALGQFKGERPAQELRGFLKDADERVRFAAARVLATRADPAALPVLLEVAREGQDPWSSYACEALGNYPDDPQAKAARKEAGYAVHRANFASWGGFLGPGLLLQQPSVQKDLKLSEQQIKQVKQADEQVTQHYREGLAQMTFREQQRQANLQALQEKLHEEMKKSLAPILTPEQHERLWQINLQQRNDALLFPEVRPVIKLR